MASGTRTVLTVVGARPQLIKAAVVSRAIVRDGGLRELILHTGQHYDDNMSQIFFDELGLPAPYANLGLGGGLHGEMTGRMLAEIERELKEQTPDFLMVYGDTDSTLAGALAAAKLNIPIAHVEAGLRSFNRAMPEEINRVLTDRISALLLAPTRTAVDLLAAEGITAGVHLIGDVMYDATRMFTEVAEQCVNLSDYEVQPGGYFLVTCHRAENTDDPARLGAIFKALGQLADARPLLLPLHPRTKKRLVEHSIAIPPSIRLTGPLGYLEMAVLEKNAHAILTDSGGVQKEAYFHGVPCITMRDETEWTETVEAEWNILVGADTDLILAAADKAERIRSLPRPEYFGDGHAAEMIPPLLLAN